MDKDTSGDPVDIPTNLTGDYAVVVLIVHAFGPQTEGDILRRYQLMVNDKLRKHVREGGVWNQEWAEKNGPLNRLPYLLPILGRLSNDGFIKFRNNQKKRIVPNGRIVRGFRNDRRKLADIETIEDRLKKENDKDIVPKLIEDDEVITEVEINADSITVKIEPPNQSEKE